MIFRRSIRFIFFVLFVIAFLCHNGGRNIFAQKPASEYDEIAEILSSKKILQVPQKRKLAQYIAKLDASDEDLYLLEDLSSKIVQKVEYDQGSLRDLLKNLERLIENKYAHRYGKLKMSDLRPSWKMLEDMERGEKDKFDYVSKRKKKARGNKYYLETIRKNSAYLTGEKGIRTTADIWHKIRNRIKSSYAAWNEKYVGLQKQNENYVGDDYYGYDKKLTYEESKFTQSFRNVQLILWRISKDDESYF